MMGLERRDRGKENVKEGCGSVLRSHQATSHHKHMASCAVRPSVCFLETLLTQAEHELQA